jgi:hypothetical protein
VDSSRRDVQVARWLVAGLLLVCGLWLLNGAIANWWVAAGPPNPNPAPWAQRGTELFVASLVAFLASFIVVWALRRKRPAA